jgi:hypothetical protein
VERTGREAGLGEEPPQGLEELPEAGGDVVEGGTFYRAQRW